MNSDWSVITECLREEIAEYGALLNRFTEQQQLLLRRDPAGVLRLSGDIEAQVRVLTSCRVRREEMVAAFATRHGRPAGATLRSLLELFAVDVRPLLEALINEVNVLIHRVRKMNRHNHTLLSRTVSAHQEMLRSLRPEAFVQTYSAVGRVSVAATTGSLRAAG